MNIDEIMTRDVVTCAPGDTILEVARKMKNHNCGLIPIIDENGTGRPMGVITDRDITCRVVAPLKDPAEIAVKDVMSRDLLNINYQATFNAAMKLMEANQVRRLIVTNDSGGLIGVLSLTDLARAVARKKLGKTFQKISQRDSSPGR